MCMADGRGLDVQLVIKGKKARPPLGAASFAFRMQNQHHVLSILYSHCKS